ncbi:MAG: serine--tRNA ligase [bacterium]
MIDIKLLRDNPKKISENLKKRGSKIDLKKILLIDKKRREILQEIESLRANQNQANQAIVKARGKEKEKKISQMKKIAQKIKGLNPKLQKVEEEFNELILELPNILRDDVKIGQNDQDNEVIKVVGKPPKFSAKGLPAQAGGSASGRDFSPKDYLTLAKELDLIDTERAAKVAGSRFGYLKNEAVLLEFALVQLAFEILRKENFILMVPPVMISEVAMAAMGFLTTHGKEEVYHLAKDNLYLVGTSEQSIGPYHMNEILPQELLPLRYAGFSTCFRREAGSYGKDTKGILRVHQFDKIEMFSFANPDKSDEEHQFLLSIEEKLMQALKLPYRVIKLCSTDTGTASARTYDIETWLPSEGRYRETHSTSTCIDYQARSLNIRYKNKVSGKNELVHTLNGTAFAIGRMILVILENYQQEDGSILIPEVLQKYFDLKIIKKGRL